MGRLAVMCESRQILPKSGLGAHTPGADPVRNRGFVTIALYLCKRRGNTALVQVRDSALDFGMRAMQSLSGFSIKSWATDLGMADVPLFGPAHPVEGSHSVLLDGSSASLAVSVRHDSWADSDPVPLSWAWSSRLRHSAELNLKTGELYVRRWDAPNEIARFAAPRSIEDAEHTIAKISRGGRSRGPDVVRRMIESFKRLRAILSPYGASNLQVIIAFNRLITALDSAGHDEFVRATTIEDVLQLSAIAGEEGRLNDLKIAVIDDVVDLVANAAPRGLPPMNPHLLLRHASGQLYQEAHFELERQPTVRKFLFGPEPNWTTKGTAARDARFTPSELARSLVEQSFNAVEFAARPLLRILDPACGSGVFLLEALRELERRRFRGIVHLVGYDSSEISAEISQFCLRQAAKEAFSAEITAHVEITRRDALAPELSWGLFDFVLMNPPFASYTQMTGPEKAAVQAVLGPDLARGHFDKSMAFVLRAVESVAPGGVVASVIPSTLLDTTFGMRWRKSLLQKTAPRSLGRFRGYSYFPGAMVEPGFIVLQSTESPLTDAPLRVVIADEGAEDTALRFVRRNVTWKSEATPGFFVSTDYRTSDLTEASWIPKNFRYRELLEALEGHETRVENIFDVKQGALSGMNAAFLLSGEELHRIPADEREFFRPAAGTSTIRDGKLSCSQWVFYPYSSQGLMIRDEEELKNRVPSYYNEFLSPNRDSLKTRRGKQDEWWTLTEPRTWQFERKPKIVSAYFGTSGHFAFDETGEFVSLHGYAWNYVGENLEAELFEGDEDLDDDSGVSFYDTGLPWAYVAILNSGPFQVLLSCYCPRVQGGQFNLSKRFVRRVPLPDLVGEGVTGDTSAELAELGRAGFVRGSGDQERLSEVVARAYGVSLDRWGLSDVEGRE